MTAPVLDTQGSELAEMRFRCLELGQKVHEAERHCEVSVARILDDCRELKWQNSVLCDLVKGYEKGENPPESWIVKLALQVDDKCENEIRNLEYGLAIEKKLEQWNKEGDRVWKNWIKIEEGLEEDNQSEPDGSKIVDDQASTGAEKKKELEECPRCEQYRKRCARILCSESLKAADEILQTEANKRAENAPWDANEQEILLQSKLGKYTKRNVMAEEKVPLLEGAMKQAKVELPPTPEYWEEDAPHSSQIVAHLRLENIGLRNELDKVQKELRALESGEDLAAVNSQKNAEYRQHMAVIERIKRRCQKQVAELVKESKERHQEWAVWSWTQFKSLTDLNNKLHLQILENQRTLKKWATAFASYEEREPWINCNPEIYVPSVAPATPREAEAPVFVPPPVSAPPTLRHPPPNLGPNSIQTPPAGMPPPRDLKQTFDAGPSPGQPEGAIRTEPAPPHSMIPQALNFPYHHNIDCTGNVRYTRNIPYLREIPRQPDDPSGSIAPYGYRVPEDDRSPNSINFPHNSTYSGNASDCPAGGAPRFTTGNSSYTGPLPYDSLLPHANAALLFSPSGGQISTDQYLVPQKSLGPYVKEIEDPKLELSQLKLRGGSLGSLAPSETPKDRSPDSESKSKLTTKARDDHGRKISSLKHERRSMKKTLFQENDDRKCKCQGRLDRLMAKYNDLNSQVFNLEEESRGLKVKLSTSEEIVAKGLKRRQELSEEVECVQDMLSTLVDDRASLREQLSQKNKTEAVPNPDKKSIDMMVNIH